jgi:uracil-DNA glycosylase
VPKPLHGDLTPWAKQGVFLLNSILTVEAFRSMSHAGKGWEELTKETIKLINKRKKGIVYMLWGKKAQAIASMVDAKNNCIIKEKHPSPMAGVAFRNTKCFSECNKYLNENFKTPIDWQLDNDKEFQKELDVETTKTE